MGHLIRIIVKKHVSKRLCQEVRLLCDALSREVGREDNHGATNGKYHEIDNILNVTADSYCSVESSIRSLLIFGSDNSLQLGLSHLS
jgi:hypothetical protein